MEGRSGKSINLGITVKIENVRNKKPLNKNDKRLMKYDDLPEYLQDNEFILDYYRCEWPLKDLVSSTFAWHNETLNIWTHLIGFMVFLTLTVLSIMEKVNVESLIGKIFRWIDEGALTMILPKPNNDSDASSSVLYARHLLESLMLKLSTGADNAAAIPRWPCSSLQILTSFYLLLHGLLRERWKPGTFDIAGHSHQIFHAFVVAGALAHAAATLAVMDWRRGQPSCSFSHDTLGWT
ncbi:hypothetical protein POM88_003234 [Heracleum sosnowskyi]|uniref:Uncharacterized protein n=1 Tax=Heracleum sosnowskyi TaxID=360622 RepID=A0AAD8JG50_9APIA|nr:hypothetical protein POM88_003234 [Heracleum sosnowskyi]